MHSKPEGTFSMVTPQWNAEIIAARCLSVMTWPDSPKALKEMEDLVFYKA